MHDGVFCHRRLSKYLVSESMHCRRKLACRLCGVAGIVIPASLRRVSACGASGEQIPGRLDSHREGAIDDQRESCVGRAVRGVLEG